LPAGLWAPLEQTLLALPETCYRPQAER
jgi:hypothetical protein